MAHATPAATIGIRTVGTAAGTLAVSIRHGADSVKAVLRRFDLVGLSSPFQSADWISAWIDTVGTPRNCEMLVVDVRDQTSGAPLFALPLVRRRVKGVVMIELPDFGMADYCGPMIAPGFAPDQATMRRLWSNIVDALPKADILRLDKVPARISGHDNPLMLLRGIRRHDLSAWGTRLTEPPLDFRGLGMSKKRIRELNNRDGKLKALGTVEFRTAATEEEADRFYAAMCAQRGTRFAELGRPNALDHADIRAFFRTMLRPGDASAPAVIQALTVNDTIIATGYGLIGRGTFCMIFPTFDYDNWRIYSPGLQHFRHSMEWACQRGLYYYDFTIGSESYKFEFGATEMDLFELYQPMSTKGIAVSAVVAARWHARRRPALARAVRHLKDRLSSRSH